MDKNLVKFANSLSPWNALSLYSHANMICLLSNYKLLALPLLERMLSTGGNGTRDLIADLIPTDCSDLLVVNTHVFCYAHSLLLLLQDWQLQVSDGRVVSVLVNRLCNKHAPSSSHFAWAPTRKAIAVSSRSI